MATARIATFILVLGLPLAAQDPHFGVGLSLSIPTGAFNSTNYGPSGSGVASNEGYDTTVAIYDLDSGKRPDPSLFRIDYDRPDRTVQ